MFLSLGATAALAQAQDQPQTASPDPQAASPDPQAAQTTPPVPADQGDPNATPERLAFDRLLVDAAVLRNQYEGSRRKRSKTRVSLSALRGLEIALKNVADADPSNTQARDMMNVMQQTQFEILGPSMAVAAVASRQLFAGELTQKLSPQGFSIVSSGRMNETLTITGTQMTRDVAQNLDRSENIFDRAKSLQFQTVIFRGGKRGRWTYDVASGRFR